MSSIRLGVIGVGHHGRHHARNLSHMPDVTLVGVVDPHEPTARQVARDCDTRAYSSAGDLLDVVDAVCIAVPTLAHHSVASMFLRRGIATLVEKPLTLSIAEGTDLVALARKHRAKLMVGHIERFNPTWSAVANSGITPVHIAASRLSRFPFRSLDVSVAFDVMVHDIDLVRSIVRRPVQSIHAVGGSVLSPSPDWVEARIHFDGGVVALLSASRIHHTTERKMTVRSADELIEVDFQRRTSVRTRHQPGAREKLRQIKGTLTQEQKDVALREISDVESQSYSRETEPLRAELEEFLAAIRDDRDPTVTGEDGLAAVEIAHRIDEAILAPIPKRLAA